MNKITKVTMYIIWIIIFLSIIIACKLLSNVNNKDYSDLYPIALNYFENNYSSPDSGKDGYKLFYEYEVLKTKEKNDNVYIFMWIYDTSCYVDEGEIVESQSASMLYKFTIKDNVVIGYENPKDGNEYEKSLEDMCDDYYLYRKVLRFDPSDYDMPEKLKTKVEKYYDEYLSTYEEKEEKTDSNNLEKETFKDMIIRYYTLANNQYLADQLTGSTNIIKEINGTKVFEYDITTDLGLNGTGDYKGRVVAFVKDGKTIFLISLTNGKYYTVNNIDNPESYFMIYNQETLDNNIVEGSVSDINEITESEFALFN